MMTWATADLAAAAQTAGIEWLVVLFHHPPYSRGSHNSDTEARLVEMRQYALPILEAAGVDMVLSGHSHSYERSKLVDGHYGKASTFVPCDHVVNGGSGNPADVSSSGGAYVKPKGFVAHSGTVYVVTGSAGQLEALSTLGPHPVMHTSVSIRGSLVLDVTPTVLSATFVTSTGAQLDKFEVHKQVGYTMTPPSCRRLRGSTPSE